MTELLHPHIGITGRSFNKSKTQYYILSVQCSLHGLVFVVFDTLTESYIAAEQFVFPGPKNEEQLAGKIKDVVSQHEWIREPFKKVNFILCNKHHTLVPDTIFNEKEKDTYLNFTINSPGDRAVTFNKVSTAKAINIFSIDKTLKEKIFFTWQNVQLFHFSTVFIESVLINFKNKADENSLFLQAHRDYFELLHMKSGKLYYHNLFSYKTKEDFIYFLLAAAEKLDLNPETIRLNLMGELDKNFVYYDILKQYIRHVSFIEKNETFQYSPELEKLSQHHHYVLFSTLQCG